MNQEAPRARQEVASLMCLALNRKMARKAAAKPARKTLSVIGMDERYSRLGLSAKQARTT